MRQRTLLLASAGIVLAVALAMAGWLVGRTTLPTELASPSAVERVEVTYQDFTDTRVVDLAVQLQDSPGLVARGAGLLTSSACVAGGSVRSGQTTFVVDRIPLVNLASLQPLTRTLAPGDHGADVRELQQAFTALGYTGTVDGVMGPRTIAFFNDLRRDLVADAPRVDVIDPSAVVWMPRTPARIVQCPLAVGSRAEPGATLAELPPSITSLRVGTMPSVIPEAARRLLVDGITAGVSEDGTVDAVAWQDISATPTLRSYLADPENVILSGSVRLAEAVRVARLPPSALFDIRGDTACVSNGATTYEGTVVSSELGYTLVRFPHGEPEEVVLTPDPRGVCA